MARWMWLWSGKCFGFRSQNLLFTCRGLHVGSFHGTVIFSAEGAYLGEVFHGKRLITKVSNKCLRHDGFVPAKDKSGGNRINLPSLAVPKGYVDFPDPESFRSEPPQPITNIGVTPEFQRPVNVSVVQGVD
jgi:hypothetical protein